VRNEEGKESISSSMIAQRAMASPPCCFCAKAMRIYYRILLRACQMLCVVNQARNVVLVGDNQTENASFVRGMREELKAGFIDHIRKEWLTPVSVFQQVKKENLNIRGAIYVAQKRT